MKIIYIARYYPPIISGAARRLSGLVEGLRAAGADVFVVAPILLDGEYGLVVPHPQAQPLAGNGKGSKTLIKDFARRWSRIPDPDVKWSKNAAAAVMESLPFKPDWIFTSTPPESVLEAGLRLKTSTGAMWACDFRDNWFINPHNELRQSKVRQYIEMKWAKKLKGKVDIGFAVNDAIAAEYQLLLGGDIQTLPHFSLSIIGDKIELPEDEVHFVHTGRFSLSDPNCDISALLSAFSEAHAVNPHLRLHLVGDLSATEKAAIHQSSSSSAIVCTGILSMRQAIGYQAAADALVLVSAPDAMAPPSKLVEYRAAMKPIIICGSDHWSVPSDTTFLHDSDGFLAVASGYHGMATAPSPALDYITAGKKTFTALSEKLS